MNSVRRRGMTGVLDGVAAFQASMPVSHLEGSSPEPNVYGHDADLPEPSLAGARLDQAERQMDWLKSRIDYLERRAASSVGATERELEDLMWVRDELTVSAARVAHLSNRLERPEAENSDAALDWDGWNEY
jgi:hypothetical protein